MKNEASLVIPAMRAALRFFILHRQAQTSRLSFIFPNNKKSSKCEAKKRNFGWAERNTIFGAQFRSCRAVNARRAE